MKTRFQPLRFAASAAFSPAAVTAFVATLATVGTGCSWGPPSGYIPPINIVTNSPQPVPQQDAFTPLMACANQRGLATQRFGELVQVHVDHETILEYHYDANRNFVMSARFTAPIPPMARAERSEMAHVRGNEIFACAGYGTPVYLGATEPAAPPPQVYANQPAPAAPPPGYEPRPAEPRPMAEPMARQQPMGPACHQLEACYKDLTEEACRAHNQHCQQSYQMRDHSEQACELALREMNAHQDEIRRNNPGFVLPGSCHAR